MPESGKRDWGGRGTGSAAGGARSAASGARTAGSARVKEDSGHFPTRTVAKDAGKRALITGMGSSKTWPLTPARIDDCPSQLLQRPTRSCQQP